MEHKRDKLYFNRYEKLYYDLGKLYKELIKYINKEISKEDILNMLDMEYINNTEIKSEIYEFYKTNN